MNLGPCLQVRIYTMMVESMLLGSPSYFYFCIESQPVTFLRLLIRIFLRVRFLNRILTSHGMRGGLGWTAIWTRWMGSYPAFYGFTPPIFAPPAVLWLDHVLPLSFIIPIDGNLNGYVKGIEIMWLEIGNEKAGHIFQVSSRAGCWLCCGQIQC